MPQFIDTVTVEPVKNVHRTSEGYLVADAFTVRTGTQVYRGTEVGRPEIPLVTVYRPEESVFNRDAVSGFAHKPITLEHPTKLVDTSNWAQHAVGEVSTEALRDGERLRLQLVVKDQAAIDAIESGTHRQLSAGYLADLEWGDGVAPDGTRYQAKQVNIRPNHVALVRRGRAGNCYIGDSDWGVVPLSDQEPTNQKEVRVTTKTVVLGDKAVDVVESHAQILLDHVADLTRQLGEATGKLAQAESRIMTDAAFTAAVDKRVKLMDEARSKAPDVDLSKVVTDGDIMRAVVKKAYPALVLDGQSDDFVRGIYATVPVQQTSNHQTNDSDPMRQALSTWTPGLVSFDNATVDQALDAEDQAWKKSLANMNEGF